ncbi:MAG: M48 family metallopeptidase [Acidobacteria bacterium]|nr:M48 family metallopeptidase [Acidobacteriota bacterium]
MGRMIAFTLAAVLTLPVSAWAKYNPDDNPKHDVSAIGDRDVDGSINLYSLEKEIGLGKQLADEVEKHSKVVDDPVISEYVNRVAQNIARNSDIKVPLVVKVLDADEVNAFALPGGYFFVNTGLVRLAENEAELAGVMAHEIAHIAARHGTRQASKGQIANLASIPLIFLGGWTGYGIRQAAGLAVPMTFLKFSRGFEQDADLLGIQYLWKAGYDPTSMVAFFERLQNQKKKKEGGGISGLFRSHPLTSKRIKLAQEAIDQILPARNEYALGGSEFANVKADLEKLMTVSSKRSKDADANRPTLKRRAPDDEIPADAEPVPQEGDQGDERPKLKRKYDSLSAGGAD